ncbi:hypothetical protein D3C85_1936360 [compost metagenome]
MYGRPHSSECAISEHSGLINALIKGDLASAEHLMDEHLSSVESRALIEDDLAKEPDIGSILSRFSSRGTG